MGKLIKTVLIVVAILIFLFSENPTVSKVRNTLFSTGKKIYSTGVDKMKTSGDSTLTSVANTIEPNKK